MAVYSYKTNRGQKYMYKFCYHNVQIKKMGFKTAKEAKEAEAEKMVLLGDGGLLKKITWHNLLDAFGEFYKLKVKATTFYVFQTRKRKFYSKLPNIDVTALDYAYFQRWWNEIETSSGVRKKLLQDLKSIFTYAESMYKVVNNEWKKLFVPKDYSIRRPKKVYVLSFNDFMKLYRVVNDPFWQNLYLTAFICGLRIGECRGIQVKCFDKERNCIMIYQQASNKMGTGKTELISTKSEKSNRYCLIPKILADRLKEQIKYYDLASDDFLFFSERGHHKPIGANTIYRRFNVEKVMGGLPEKITFHVFRKTEASILNDEGLSGEIIRDYLGHDSYETTKNYYIGDSIEKKNMIRGIMDSKFDSVMFGKKNQKIDGSDV